MDDRTRPSQPSPRAGSDRERTRHVTLVLVVAVLVCVAGALALALVRHHREAGQRDRLARAAAEGPRVLVATATRPSDVREVTLPGDVRAFWQTTLYAKVNGYVRRMDVDKGDRVKRGQVLAAIASPETDRQVDQARSTLQVRRRLARRVRALAPRGIVSQQDLDQANADLAIAEAELRRVQALQDYEVLRAPFDGVVTARYADPGALLSSTGSGQPVLEVSDPARSRVLVYVGQDVAPFVRLGDEGVLRVEQLPGLEVRARVRRMADALDPRSRSMLVELWPDPGGDPAFRLVPGLFVHVALKVKVPAMPAVPEEALVSRGEKLQVALVRDQKLHFVEVEPGATDGKTLQIRRGLSGGETVALSPPSDLGEGAAVQAVEPKKRQADAGGQQRRGRAGER
ncbi:efflux RND transporter periplasmic adaptor subunit [Anaeromyxobacter paludicola]|uniref:Secretion protein HlyD n=1 Tax=Anaeromyxobacter paludicola TaxID=2918171 RepID=A0ABN6N5Q6_9BACT|nr:efflux RND transporter periplasmic adaptor subunit [Anaeromyxobacter paludicola]BDG08499.1 secretion protein HlyD [Anaeromyxobacter paludicola]